MPTVVRAKAGTQRFNVTKVLATLNPHIAIRSEEAFHDFETDMDHVLNSLMESNEAISKVFGNDPFVEEVKFGDANYEVGEKRHTGHIHMVITITHSVAAYSVPYLQERLKNWLNANYDGSEGWYVNLRILDTKAINYASKNARRARNAEFEQQYNQDPEYQKLSSNW